MTDKVPTRDLAGNILPIPAPMDRRLPMPSLLPTTARQKVFQYLLLHLIKTGSRPII
jgi:hypothetical protein